MDYTAFSTLVQATQDAIKTLTKIAAQTSGWTRESINLQLDELQASLQEALNSASPAMNHKPAVGKSVPIMGIIGHVHCINVAATWPEKLRYYGHFSRETAGEGPTGQAHMNYDEAVADVLNWYENKPVAYEKQAVTPLVPLGTSWESAARQLESQGIARLAGAATAGMQPSQTIGAVLAQPGGEQLVAELLEKRNKTQAQITVALGGGFAIGPNNTGLQAWEAMLQGHFTYRPHWHDTRRMFIVQIPADGFVYPKGSLDFMLTTTTTQPDLKNSVDTAVVVKLMAADLAATDWIVLPNIHHESPTV